MPKVWNKRDANIPKDAVYVGRPSKWGNPFEVKVLGRDKAIAAFEDYYRRSGLVAEIQELRGKDLICWCAPKACHADILLREANK